MATVKLTRKLLERIIKEERQKLHETFGKPEDVEKRANDTEEVEADEYGTDKTLENPIDHMKALKIREAAFVAALVKLSEARTKSKSSKKDEAAKKKAADKKKADDKKAKAKKEAQDKAKKSKKNESVRSVKMNEAQLVEALQTTRAKIELLKSKSQKKA